MFHSILLDWEKFGKPTLASERLLTTARNVTYVPSVTELCRMDKTWQYMDRTTFPGRAVISFFRVLELFLLFFLKDLFLNWVEKTKEEERNKTFWPFFRHCPVPFLTAGDKRQLEFVSYVLVKRVLHRIYLEQIRFWRNGWPAPGCYFYQFPYLSFLSLG